MSFSKKIKYFLVHALSVSNKEAQRLISCGKVEIDGIRIFDNCLLDDASEVRVDGKLERPKQHAIYLKFYKPVGYQSSLNEKVDDNLAGFFRAYHGLAIAGRLDKMSEGLLILSNDGKWIEKMCNPKFEKEKEYIVTLDKNPDQIFVNAFKSGVNFGKYISKDCGCEIVSDKCIRVVLKEGKNRQIRRMCAALGYRVLTLKRTRIAGVALDNLLSGQYETIDNEKISII